MRRAVALAAVLALIVAVRLAMPAEAGEATAAMALGFVLLVSFGVGRAATRLGLPSITGYILTGLMAGPYVLGWVHPAFAVLGHSAVASLRLLDAVALGLIALGAGGELRLASLRTHARTIGAVIAGQVLLVFGGVVLLVLAGGAIFPSLRDFSHPQLLAAALLFGAVAASNSPASTLAIVQEYHSRGPVTEVVLAVVVAMDVVVISLFTIVLSFAILLVRPGAAFDAAFRGALGWEVLGSIAVGALLGGLVAQYVERLGRELPLLVLGVAFVAVVVLPTVHLSGLLALMVAGFVIENFSPHGDDVMRAIERHALPVYVVFFTIAGASLNLEALGATLPLAGTLALWRAVLISAGTVLGARVAGAAPVIVRHGWSGFVAQAGVTLGLAIVIEQRFPEIGLTVKTVLLAVIAVNQLVGPVLFRLGLFRAGEAHVEEDAG